jgi:pyruvate ferredoxin oxidoreductase gamma subunit
VTTLEDVTTFDVRIHGRGGQGAVTAADLLSVAAFDCGLHAQAFPTFGSERTGAPVVSFCRMGEDPITTHEPVAEPDAVIVQDPTLLRQVRVLDGLRPGGFVLINTQRTFAELGLGDLVLPAGHLVAVPATELARRFLGRPLPNTALLGAFAALTGRVTLHAVETAIRGRFHGLLGEENVDVAGAAYDAVLTQRGGLAHA